MASGKKNLEAHWSQIMMPVRIVDEVFDRCKIWYKVKIIAKPL